MNVSIVHVEGPPDVLSVAIRLTMALEASEMQSEKFDWELPIVHQLALSESMGSRNPANKSTKTRG